MAHALQRRLDVLVRGSVNRPSLGESLRSIASQYHQALTRDASLVGHERRGDAKELLVAARGLMDLAKAVANLRFEEAL